MYQSVALHSNDQVCSWRHSILYLLAEIELEVDGVPTSVVAAVSEMLLVAVLLETNVSEPN